MKRIRKLVIVAALVAALSAQWGSVSAQPEQRWISGCYLVRARTTIFNTYLPLCMVLRLPIIAKWVR